MVFIVSPRIGLCNQLQTIVKGILLAIKFNRNIYIDRFQIDLQNNNLCDIRDILDIEKINIFLQDIIKIPIKILDIINIDIINNLHNYRLPNIDYNNIAHYSYINDDIELNNKMEIIYLGNIVSLDLYKSFNYIYDDYSNNNLYYLIINNIKFNKIFYKIKDIIKEELKLTKFNSIHLRIEDDAIKYFSKCYNLSVEDYNIKILNFYNDNIKKLNQNNTYICSGILDFDNTINLDYYKNIKNDNKLLCDKKNIIIDNYYLDNRELIAIIDLLVAFDSDFFIGCHISSFSQVIKNYFKYNKKNCILFNIN